MLQRQSPSLMRISVGGFVLLLGCLMAMPVSASWLDNVLRHSLKMGQKTSLTHSDEVLQALSRNSQVQRSLERNLAKDTPSSMRQQAREQLVRRTLAQAAHGLDNQAVQQLSKLDPSRREALSVLLQGGQDLAQQVPDLAMRGQLLERGGTELVAASGLHGKALIKDALRLDLAMQAGRVASAPGARAVSLKDFAQLMSRSGSASWQFWQAYVAPHWKLWLSSGALSAYLLDPEGFENAAGELSAAGMEHLTVLVGKVAAGAIRGIDEGSEQAAAEISSAVRETYLESSGRYYAWGFTALVLGLLLWRLSARWRRQHS